MTWLERVTMSPWHHVTHMHETQCSWDCTENQFLYSIVIDSQYNLNYTDNKSIVFLDYTDSARLSFILNVTRLRIWSIVVLPHFGTRLYITSSGTDFDTLDLNWLTSIDIWSLTSVALSIGACNFAMIDSDEEMSLWHVFRTRISW